MILFFNVEEYSIKIEETTKKAIETTIPARKITRKPWISEQTLKLADEKRRLKQMKNVSTEHAQQYKDICKKSQKISKTGQRALDTGTMRASQKGRENRNYQTSI